MSSFRFAFLTLTIAQSEASNEYSKVLSWVLSLFRPHLNALESLHYFI